MFIVNNGNTYFQLQMMLYGGIFGCLSPILTISAFLSYKLPFVYPKDEVLPIWLCEFIIEFCHTDEITNTMLSTYCRGKMLKEQSWPWRPIRLVMQQFRLMVYGNLTIL